MRQMFESATLKLTVWYLAILMTICIFFSLIIYQISSAEVATRLSTFEERFEPLPVDPMSPLDSLSNFWQTQLHEAQLSLLVALFYSNLTILVLGGLGSYFLARRTLQPIETSHEAIARFTSDASHEFRTPLAAMKSELEVGLRNKKTSKQELRELLESNLEEVNRLSELSKTLLQLSRQDYDKLEMERVKLSEVVTRAIIALGVSQNRFQVEIPAKTSIKANTSSLTELVMILLDNAVSYSPPDSTISIAVSSRGPATRLRISNTGKGIAPEDVPFVFDRFYRGDKSRTSQNSPNHGLGLSLAKKIADIHGASIAITSQPSAPTTVTVSFKKYLP